MISVRNGLVAVVSTTAALTVGLAACSSDDSPQPTSAGERIALASGCTACHGPNGEGGAGPAWKGLFGSEVKLADGSIVTADAAYLTESIRNPAAKQVAGYGLMPENSLNDVEIQAVVEFIQALGAPK